MNSPLKFVAATKDKKIYFVIKDNQPILTFISFDTNNNLNTYVIPKKYCVERPSGYIIDKPDKLIVISCRIVQDDYEEIGNKKIRKIWEEFKESKK